MQYGIRWGNIAIWAGESPKGLSTAFPGVKDRLCGRGIAGCVYYWVYYWVMGSPYVGFVPMWREARRFEVCGMDTVYM
jgi:hypothetical protein